MKNSPGTNYFSPINDDVNVALTSEDFGNFHVAVLAECSGNPNVVAIDADTYAVGCYIIRLDIVSGNNVYVNQGTVASPSWILIGTGSGGSETLAQVSAASITQPDNTYTIPTDISVLFNSTDALPNLNQIAITADTLGYLGFLNYGPGDQEIHFDVSWDGLTGEYIAQNTAIAAIIENGGNLQFWTCNFQTVGMPVTDVFQNNMNLDAVGNWWITGVAEDIGLTQSWDFNNRLGFASDGTTIFNYHKSNGPLTWGDVNQVANWTWISIEDERSIVTINGVQGIDFSGTSFTGSGADDISISGGFSGTPPVTFTITVLQPTTYTIFTSPSPSPDWTAGSTLTVTSGPDIGATCQILFDGGTSEYYIYNLSIMTPLQIGDVLDDGTGNTGTISVPGGGPQDTYSWSSTDGGTSGGVPQFMQTTPTPLFDGISVDWTTNLGTHVAGDQWTFSYSFQVGRMAVFDGGQLEIKIGDVDSMQNSSLLTIDDGQESLKYFSELGDWLDISPLSSFTHAGNVVFDFGDIDGTTMAPLMLSMTSFGGSFPSPFGIQAVIQNTSDGNNYLYINREETFTGSSTRTYAFGDTQEILGLQLEIKDMSGMFLIHERTASLGDVLGNFDNTVLSIYEGGFGSIGMAFETNYGGSKNALFKISGGIGLISIGDVNTAVNGTVFSVEDSTETVTISAVNIIFPLLGGSGTGYVAIDNTGLLSFSDTFGWSDITGTPTTLSGYGITDSYPLSGNPSGFLTSASSLSWSNITGTPTTLAGYGITDGEMEIPSGSFSQSVVAVTTFSVTIPTQASTAYQTFVTPTNILSAAVFYVTSKTTTSFSVVYLTALTGTVAFDWSIIN